MARKTGTTRRTARPAPQSDGAHAPKWIGLGAILLGVVLLAYLAYAVALYFTDLTDDFTRFWTNLFYYPATHVYTSGYLGWFLLSLLVPLLAFLGLAEIVWGRRRGTFAGRVVVLAGVCLVAAAVLQYVVPPPSHTAIGYGSYLDRYETLKTFQAKQAQLQPGAQQTGDPELRATALQQLTLANIIRQEATKYGVSVPQKEVDDFYKRQAEQNQGEANLEKQLKDFLGWTPKQFKQEVELRLLQEKLNQKLATDENLNKDRKQKADEYLDRLKKGEDFAAVAKEAGGGLADGTEAAVAVKRGEADPKVEAAIFKLQPAELSEVITTDQGYVIVRVDEKPSADELKIRQITVATQSLNEFIPEELKKAKVSVYVHDLVWDKSLYTVRPKQGTESEQPVIQGTDSPTPAAAPAQ